MQALLEAAQVVGAAGRDGRLAAAERNLGACPHCCLHSSLQTLMPSDLAAENW